MNKQMAQQTVVLAHNRILLSSKKKNELIYTTCMNLKNILLSESRQTQKSTYYMTPFR